MKPSPSRIELVRARLAETVATVSERTPEEQRRLIARLLGTAFEERRKTSPSV